MLKSNTDTHTLMSSPRNETENAECATRQVHFETNMRKPYSAQAKVDQRLDYSLYISSICKSQSHTNVNESLAKQ